LLQQHQQDANNTGYPQPMYHNSTQQQQQQQGSVPLSAHAPYSSSTPSGYSGYNSGYSSMQPPASGWSSSAGVGQMQSSSGGTGQVTMAYTSGSIPLPHAPAGKAGLIAECKRCVLSGISYVQPLGRTSSQQLRRQFCPAASHCTCSCHFPA
jgi:hypothetical protein